MTRNLTWENVLTYSKDFSDIHNLQAMVGTCTILNSKEYTYAGGKGQVYADNWFHNLYSNEKEITIKEFTGRSKSGFLLWAGVLIIN